MTTDYEQRAREFLDDRHWICDRDAPLAGCGPPCSCAVEIGALAALLAEVAAEARDETAAPPPISGDAWLRERDDFNALAEIVDAMATRLASRAPSSDPIFSISMRARTLYLRRVDASNPDPASK